MIDSACACLAGVFMISFCRVWTPEFQQLQWQNTHRHFWVTLLPWFCYNLHELGRAVGILIGAANAAHVNSLRDLIFRHSWGTFGAFRAIESTSWSEMVQLNRRSYGYEDVGLKPLFRVKLVLATDSPGARSGQWDMPLAWSIET